MPLKKVESAPATKTKKAKYKRRINEKGLYNFLNKYIKDIELVIIEHQQTFGGQGIASNGYLMEQYGYLKGICEGAGLEIITVPPKEWQKIIKNIDISIPLSIKKELQQYSYPENKLETLAICRSLFPNVNLTQKSKKLKDGMADSILIAYSYLIKNKN